MTEQKLEYLYRLDYSHAVEAGIRCGRIATVVIAVDLVLTLVTMSLYSLVSQLSISMSLARDLRSIIGLGEILAAIVFFLLLVVFLYSGVVGVKNVRGTGSLLEMACLSLVSGLVTGAMASAVLVVSKIVIALYSMPQNGYITMFSHFSANTVFDVLMWVPAIGLMALVSGVCYAGMGMRLRGVT